MEYDEFVRKYSFSLSITMLGIMDTLDEKMIENMAKFVCAPLQSLKEDGTVLTQEEHTALAIIFGITAERFGYFKAKS